MRLKRSFLAWALGCGMAFAQPPEPADHAPTFATSAEIRRLIEKAAASIKPDQPSLSLPLLDFAPYSAVLEYRQAAAPAYMHEDQAELIYVVDGSGTLTEGGQLIDAKARDAHNISGSGITGGAERRIASGDMFVIPEGAPHWFSAIQGRLVLITTKVPRVTAAR